MVNKIVVGAHYGLRDWIMQRVTALMMLAYTAVFIVLLLSMPHTHEGWQALFKMTWVKLFSTLTFAGLALHVWVGIRDVWMDYVKPVGLRLTLHVGTILWLLGVFVYSVKVVWSV